MTKMCKTCRHLGKEKATDTNNEIFYCKVYGDVIEDINEIFGCDDYHLSQLAVDTLEIEENTLNRSKAMTEKDWKEIRELRKEFIGTTKGIALGNLIAEQQRLKCIIEIVKDYDGSQASMITQFTKIQKLLEEEIHE